MPDRDHWHLTQPSHYSLSSQSEPQHDTWCHWHLPPNAWSVWAAPIPFRTSHLALWHHLVNSWCPIQPTLPYGSATSHQQLVSLKIRKPQLNFFPYTDTAHTLFVEKTSSLFSCMFYKWISKCNGIHQRELRKTFTLIMLLSKLVTSLRL